jgi:alpha-glucoside transport system permease protein
MTVKNASAATGAAQSVESEGLGKRLYRLLSSVPTGVLWLLVVLWTAPTAGIFVNSFRNRDAQKGTPWWLAWLNLDEESGASYTEYLSEAFSLDNYRDVLSVPGSSQPTIWEYFVNSFAIVIPATVIPIAIAAFAAYAFAWIQFRGREWIFVATVSLLAIPLQMSLIPLLSMYSRGAQWTIPFLDKTIRLFPDIDALSNTAVSVWLTHTGFALPFAIFLLHNYISTLPGEIMESAHLDGADHFTIFRKLVLPLSVPVLAAFAIFQFLWTWNDFLIATTFIGGNRAELPLTVNLGNVAGEFGRNEHLMPAVAFLATFMPLVVFFALQRYFVRGILAGSTKG